MLTTKEAIATRTISTRTDVEMYMRTKSLAHVLNTDPSTIVRIALSKMLNSEQCLNAKTLKELL